MNRITSDNTFEMNMYQLALNQVYIEDGWAWYRNAPEDELSVCDLIRSAAETLGVDLPMLSDDDLSSLMTDWLQYRAEEPEGVLAILYRALWAMAEVRARLAAYEDTGLEPEEIALERERTAAPAETAGCDIANRKEGTMAKQKEIKFRDRAGDLVGRQNGMTFYIFKDPDLGKTCAPAHSVAVYINNGELQVSTGGRRYFRLDGAREFCQKIAAGEIKVEDVLAEFAAEDAAKERAALQKVTEKAKKFQKRLDAKGLKYTDLLELEVLAHSLGDMGHNILLGYEHGEGWPSGI